MKPIKIISATLMMAGSIAANAQDSGNTTPNQTQAACSAATPATFVWRPAAWPSPEFIKQHRINYIGPCDSFVADSAEGIVTARLANPDGAEEIRCKYEMAGLGEWHRERFNHTRHIYQEIVREIAASCSKIAEETHDVDLASSWKLLSSLAR